MTADIRTREGSAHSLADSANSKPHPPPTLIQELSSEVTEGGGRVCVPQYSVTVSEGGRGKEVSAKVILPGVRGVKEVELEVSEVYKSKKQIIIFSPCRVTMFTIEIPLLPL